MCTKKNIDERSGDDAGAYASSDYRIGAVRVVANPHGYAGENPAFDPMLIVEVCR